MGYWINYINLRVAVFLAGHFRSEPEYVRELYIKFLDYGNSIPASQYMRHGKFMEYAYKLEKIAEAVP